MTDIKTIRNMWGNLQCDVLDMGDYLYDITSHNVELNDEDLVLFAEIIGKVSILNDKLIKQIDEKVLKNSD